MASRELNYRDSEAYVAPEALQIVRQFIGSETEPEELLRLMDADKWTDDLKDEILEQAAGLIALHNGRRSVKQERLRSLVDRLESKPLSAHKKYYSYRCTERGYEDIFVTFDTHELNEARLERFKKAAAICGRCVVKDACRVAGTKEGEDGTIWGGHVITEQDEDMVPIPLEVVIAYISKRVGNNRANSKRTA